MASAARAANVRTVIATVSVANTLHITHLDGATCTVVVDDQSKLAGPFSNLGIQDFQMPAFRQVLASLCPEKDVHDTVSDENQFPLSASTPIPMVVGALEASLENSASFNGTCLPTTAQSPKI
jgi:hypothetical protein